MGNSPVAPPVDKASYNAPYSRIAIAACALYFLIGQAFIPLLGIEDDESLFAMPLLQPRSYEYSLHWFHRDLALMLMSYLGTLKTLIFKFVVQAFGTGVWAIREPMLIAGAVSVWAFYLSVRRVAGERAAVAACVLLSLDSVYLLTSCFDWGPVALQHLLINGGAYALVRFYQQRNPRVLAAGCFAFGLAAWDKALAAWMLSGLVAATLAVCWPQVRKVFSMRRLGVALLAFCAGALPLILYNVTHHGATFSGTLQRETNRFPEKATLLLATVQGPALFGYLTDDDSHTPRPHELRGPQALSQRIADVAGEPRRNLMLYGLIAALVLTPFGGLRTVKIVLFALIAAGVAWVQMAMTATAGGSAHHTMLLWPLPPLIVAAGLAGASQRIGRGGAWVLAAVVTVLGVSCLLNTNTYYRTMASNGGSLSWTDAINPLRDRLMTLHPQTVYCLDWGILDNLRLLSRGKLPLVWPDDLSPAAATALTSQPDAVFITHVEADQYFPDRVRQVSDAAKSAGYERESVETIFDSFGRPTFEVYRFRPRS